MGIDLFASDPIFSRAGKKAGERVDELIAYARERLGLGDDCPWTLVGSRGKLGKTLFEVDAGGRRIIGKVSRSERARRTYETLEKLWECGMRPPSKYVVSRPVAWFPERHMLLQERARGVQLLELIRRRSPEADAGVEQAAHWLRSLQGLKVDVQTSGDLLAHLQRCRTELPSAMPAHAARVERVLQQVADCLAVPQPSVASHGDYHPMNVYIAGDGQVTAIDLDTFAAREPTFDAAYFIAQTAIMGFHMFGGFEATRGLRQRFQAAAPQVDEARCETHVRFALLRSLHYDLCILHVPETSHVEPFLDAAERGLDG
jgi:hypothetical protein